MPPREIVAYTLIALIVLAVAWAFLANLRKRKLDRDMRRGKIRPPAIIITPPPRLRDTTIMPDCLTA